MRIVFIPTASIPIHKSILEERPLGGTETGIVRLADALHELRHEVIVMTEAKNPPLSKPLYLPMSELGSLTAIDVLISVRGWMPLFFGLPAKKKYLWTGDAADQPQTIGIGDKRVIERLDGLLCVSEWQADELSRSSGFPRKRCLVIQNGIHQPYFSQSETRLSHRLIYSSTPYRGLRHLPRLFAQVKAKVPEATLAVFSSMEVYAPQIGQVPHGHEASVRELEQIKAQFAELPGVEVHGSVRQEQLAKEFLRSRVLAYPNTFGETSCITAMEAQAAGCVPVTSARAGLRETVGEAGFLIRGEPGTKEYDSLFVEKIVQLLTDEKLFEDYSARAMKLNRSWGAVAARLVSCL